jgi:hypothetical protein
MILDFFIITCDWLQLSPKSANFIILMIPGQ